MAWDTPAFLAGHWTSGSEGLPPALLVLVVIPYLALALVGWLLYRHLGGRSDGDARGSARPPRRGRRRHRP